MLIALSREIAPPIKPLAWTKSISAIPERFLNFYISLTPRQSWRRGSLSSNEPSFLATAWIRHFFRDFSGKTTNKISPMLLVSSYTVDSPFCQGTYEFRRMILPEGWVLLRFSKAVLTIPVVWIEPRKACLTSVINYSSTTFIALSNWTCSSAPSSHHIGFSLATLLQSVVGTAETYLS